MKIDLGCTMEQLVEAVNEASAAPSNMVTTDSAQTISGAKTFTKTTTFQNDIKANGSVGTSGQVLVSQGSGNSPKWGDVPAPSNVVTTNTDQTITAKKNFNGGLAVDGSNAYFANVASNANGSIIDCYENEGTGDSIFSVYTTGGDKGEVFFGDGSVDVNISLGNYTYISSDFRLGASSTSYPRNIVQKTGMTLLTSPSANIIASTTYGASGISRSLGNYGYTISLPSRNGTLALTSDIPPKMSYYNVNFAIRRSSSTTVYISWGVVAKQGYTTVKALIQGITGSTTARLNVPTSVTNYTYNGTTYSLGYLSTNGTPSGTTCYNTNGTSFTPYHSSSTETIGSIAAEFKY